MTCCPRARSRAASIVAISISRTPAGPQISASPLRRRRSVYRSSSASWSNASGAGGGVISAAGGAGGGCSFSTTSSSATSRSNASRWALLAGLIFAGDNHVVPPARVVEDRSGLGRAQPLDCGVQRPLKLATAPERVTFIGEQQLGQRAAPERERWVFGERA